MNDEQPEKPGAEENIPAELTQSKADSKPALPPLPWSNSRKLQAGVNILMVVLLVVLVFLIGQRQLKPRLSGTSRAPIRQNESAFAAAPMDNPGVSLTPLDEEARISFDGIWRRPNFHTVIPSRPRSHVVTYTVETGDTLFSIAEQYGIKPETVLWGNLETLNDNPHMLSPDQVLNILPTEGAYYRWKEGDQLGAVAAMFEVEPQAIIDYPGNRIDLTQVQSDTYGIEVGAWLIIPNGKRPIKDWGPPAISRENPAAARYLGEGSCGSVYEGAIGTGTFVWPATGRSISGYHYSSIHPAIDIGGALGSPVYASDSGVIVYAGWSSHGYGNLIVIDHGNGFQTAYAHLDTVAVTCGQSVFQGGYIGGLGTTGNSSGPHLHFELVLNGAKPNPLDYLQ